jgi:HlyD family secretion protein
LFWIASVLSVAAVAVVVAVLAGTFTGGGSQGTQAVFEVAQGPLTISVSESGTVQPKDQIILKSEVEGTTTILFLVEEGTKVKKGDLLVELDASKLQDSKVEQEIRVQNAEASWISSRENYEVVKNQAQSDIDKATLELKFAQEDLKQYEEGEYPNELKQRDSQITLAKEQLERAQEKLNWSTVLYGEKYLSESELKADQLGANKAQVDLDIAQSNLALLKDYTYHRNLDELQSAASQATMALERVTRKASADTLQAEANLKAKEAEFEQQQSKLTKMIDQIEKAKIYAPADGLLVYATSARTGGFRHSSVEPLDEGGQVRERQELIYLPTGSDFVANVSVHESSLQKIRSGLPVRITVDALPGQSFTGKVASIAPLPNAQSMYMNPDLKVYDTIIDITGAADQLRSGMSCRAEIVIEHYPDAMYVPIQAVTRVKGETAVFVVEDGDAEPRPVEIGLDNNSMIRIISGLAPGEKVLLAPPIDASSASSVEDKAGGLDLTELQFPPAASDASPPREGRLEGRGGDRPEMTPEEREKRRQQFENMTPEEREALRQQRPQGGNRPRTGPQEQ